MLRTERLLINSFTCSSMWHRCVFASLIQCTPCLFSPAQCRRGRATLPSATWPCGRVYLAASRMSLPVSRACLREASTNIPDLRHPLFSLTVHLYTLLLLPLLHSLWLLTGTGNANFFYAATMVYGLNATLAIADVLSAIFVGDIKQRYAAVTGKPVAEVESLDVVQLASLS